MRQTSQERMTFTFKASKNCRLGCKSWPGLRSPVNSKSPYGIPMSYVRICETQSIRYLNCWAGFLPLRHGANYRHVFLFGALGLFPAYPELLQGTIHRPSLVFQHSPV